jgi:hypothetical protein
MIDLDNLISIDLDKLQPGEVVVYATTTSLARLRDSTKRQPALQIASADAAWQAALTGRVDLLQRRRGAVIEYIAIGRAAVDRHPVQPMLVEGEMRRRAADYSTKKDPGEE